MTTELAPPSHTNVWTLSFDGLDAPQFSYRAEAPGFEHTTLQERKNLAMSVRCYYQKSSDRPESGTAKNCLRSGRFLECHASFHVIRSWNEETEVSYTILFTPEEAHT
ncbi:hypothetical protein TNCV_3387911 [Trichonephila clavipes]|nr:hypothetical protein TNCV_3387911 [Trichonephila clavipes]